jgi:hypothetical protein
MGEAGLRTVKPRGSERKRVLLAGKIANANGAQVVNCTIRDLSETGARVSPAGDVVIPQHCYLVVGKGGGVFEAEIAWIKLPQYGLKFERRIPLDDTLPPHLQFLKRIATAA